MKITKVDVDYLIDLSGEKKPCIYYGNEIYFLKLNVGEIFQCVENRAIKTSFMVVSDSIFKGGENCWVSGGQVHRGKGIRSVGYNENY